MPKKTAAKVTRVTRVTKKAPSAKRYVAKVYVSPGHDPEGKGLNEGDKVSAKRAKEIAAASSAKLSDLFK